MEVALLPQYHFVAAFAVSYSIIHGNPASGGGWKKTKQRENVCGNVVVSEQKNKIKMGKQRAAENRKDKETIKITREVSK